MLDYTVLSNQILTWQIPLLLVASKIQCKCIGKAHAELAMFAASGILSTVRSSNATDELLRAVEIH